MSVSAGHESQIRLRIPVQALAVDGDGAVRFLILSTQNENLLECGEPECLSTTERAIQKYLFFR